MDEIEDFQQEDKAAEIKNAATAAMEKLKKYYRKADAPIYAITISMYFCITNYDCYLMFNISILP